MSFNDDGSIVDQRRPRASPHRGTGFDGPFGFFAKISSASSDSPVFLFTQADLNGGDVRAKVFQGNGTTTLTFPACSPVCFCTNQFLIAFETSHDGSSTTSS